ncbi:MAG: regulatory protein GemA [Victivallaceae bacterium]|nr:regulatory protein GemA [Victivallaceae bacterium]
MGARNFLAAIHITKKDAHLTDARYRLILHKATGVDSCSGMTEDQQKAALIALKAELNHKPGWQQRQINKLKQYARFCRMSDEFLRRLIQYTTGWMNEDSPHLDQTHFDDIMVEMEKELSHRINNNIVTLPKGVDIKYWRNRHPNKGKINSRQHHLILELWEELCEYLTPERRTMQYLFGLVAQSCSMTYAKPLDELTKYQAVTATEALKLRIEQQQKKQNNTQQYPTKKENLEALF